MAIVERRSVKRAQVDDAAQVAVQHTTQRPVGFLCVDEFGMPAGLLNLACQRRAYTAAVCHDQPATVRGRAGGGGRGLVPGQCVEECAIALAGKAGARAAACTLQPQPCELGSERAIVGIERHIGNQAAAVRCRAATTQMAPELRAMRPGQVVQA